MSADPMGRIGVVGSRPVASTPTATPPMGAARATQMLRGAGASTAKGPTKDAKVAHAAQELEAVFVRQLVSAMHITSGGAQKESGYASMATDALADSITHSGGLGLAQRIEQALAAHNSPPKRESGDDR